MKIITSRNSQITLIASLIFLPLIMLAIPTKAAAETVCCEIQHIQNFGYTEYKDLSEADCRALNNEDPNNKVVATPKKGKIVGQAQGSSVKSCIDDLGTSLPKFTNPIDNPKLAVNIPGFLGFRSIKCEIASSGEKTGEECVVSWLADYMQAIYRYGIGAILILAVVVMMIGGVVWLTASGNDKKISDAKNWINGSLFGVLIALSSYMILNIVNPALTTLSPIKLTSIGKIDLYELSTEEQEINLPVDGNNETPTNQGSNHGVPWFLQGGALGKSIGYSCGGTTISSSGCGVVATLMVLGKFGKTPSMQEFTKACLDAGARVCGNGSTASGLIKAANKYDLKGELLNGKESIKKKLDEGVPVIISVRGSRPPCVFTNGGHFIVLTGWRDKDKEIADVNDPANGKNQENRTWISLKTWGGCTLNQQFYLYK